jgi:hypothetical protein
MLRLILALLAFVFPAAAFASCPPELFHTAAAEIDDAGRVYVPLSINDHTVQALICTSCPWSSLGEAFVDRIGLKKRPKRVRYAAVDGSKVEYLTLPGFTRIGGMRLNDDFLVDSGSGEDATIGINMLLYFDFEIDNGKKTVSFYRHQEKLCGRAPNAWPGTVALPFDLRGEVIKAVVDANGRTLRTGVYTGTAHTMMALGVARQQFGVTPQTPGVRSTGQTYFEGAAKGFDTYEYVMPQMTLSGLTFTNVPLRLIDLDGYGINLGMHELRQTRFFVAFVEKKIYIAPIEPAR